MKSFYFCLRKLFKSGAIVIPATAGIQLGIDLPRALKPWIPAYAGMTNTCRACLVLILLAGLLAGCATPRYQTAYRYEPPTDAAGRACLAECEAILGTCRNECRQKHQACLKRIEPEVETRYEAALKAYEADLERYRLDLMRYEFQLTLDWWHGGLGYSPWPYSPWPGPQFAPTPPRPKPTREAVFEQVSQTQCDVDCGCQSRYDACFLRCGGKKIPETVCIANCPPQAKPQ